MFKLLRTIHLYTAFVIASFLLMYFFTGGIMVMEKTFPRKKHEMVSEKSFIDPSRTETESINEILERYNIYGEMKLDKTQKGNTKVNITRPGYKAEIFFLEEPDSVGVVVKEGGFAAVMNDFHRLKGYRGSWTHKVWAFLYDLSCIALLLFACTGIYLWWKLDKERWVGFALLTISTGITAFTIWYLYSIG